jgi:hypothetical protein
VATIKNVYGDAKLNFLEKLAPKSKRSTFKKAFLDTNIIGMLVDARHLTPETYLEVAVGYRYVLPGSGW